MTIQLRSKRRKAAILQLYKRLPWHGGCFYCGAHATTIDHCPPYAWLEELGSAYFSNAGIELLLIPACRECNGLLGSMKIFCPLERRTKAQEKLRKRYRKVIAAAQWSWDELQELGPRLRQYVRVQDDYSKFILRRLRFGETEVQP